MQPFQGLMRAATRLTQAGDLKAATAAIQAALAGKAPAPSDATAIDVEARLVDEGEGAPQQPAPGGDTFSAGSFGTGTMQRNYKLYVPPGAPPQAPLVVMLHGCKQEPDDFAAGTAMNEAARAQGFYVLYPGQSQQANPQRCWNWFKHSHQRRGQGEPALLAGMTREVM